MATDEFVGQQIPVNDQLDLMLGVKEQLQSGYGAGNGLKEVSHMAVIGEGQPGAPQLGGQEFGFKGLVARHHQQIELRLLAVAEKQIFADLRAQDRLYLLAELNGVGVVMVNPDKGNGQLLQPVIDGKFLGDAVVSGAGGIAVFIYVHIGPS